MLVDNGIYVRGERVARPQSLAETWDRLHTSGGMAWIGLYRPTEDELQSVAAEFHLHPLAVEDAQKGHQRAKLERYGQNLFVVLRPASRSTVHGGVEFGEIHLFTGPDFVVTVRHAESPRLSDVRRRLEAEPAMLAKGPEAVLCEVLDEVVDGYAPVVTSLQSDIDGIDDDLFDGVIDPRSSKRIYHLLAEVIAFQRAIDPVPIMLEALLRGAGKYGTDAEVQHDLRNVLDHAIRITERVDTFRVLLENALSLHSTLVMQEQNAAMRDLAAASLREGEESHRLAQLTMEQGEQVKRISAWAAILFAPTLVASIYGMNFAFMPELQWPFGYPLALLLMLVSAIVFWIIFKARRWL